jgi:flagellar protein FliS
MAASEHAPQAYREVQVHGADRRWLVVLLLQGLVKFLARARTAMQERNHETKASALNRAEAILGELVCSLDEEKVPDFARSLRALYAHLQRELVEVDLQDDQERLAYVTEIAEKLRDAWEEAWRKCQEQERQGRQ